ncbi:IS4 family transposase, partial [Craterilacuibacter sp.]|uniref:IS4 family transposase n=1 Tax=Craterilacuibacter sp. TaxID=2870909 RepID=UPI003F3C918F
AFDAGECRVAYALHRKKPPARPTVNQVLRLIAMLGGFIGRKGDGEPGVKTIWLGLQVLHNAIQAFNILTDAKPEI